MKRRDPLEGYSLSELIRPRREPQKKEERTRAIYTVPEALRDRVKEIAEEERVWPSDMGRLFLEIGVSLYEDGRLEGLLEEMKGPRESTRYTLYGGRESR